MFAFGAGDAELADLPQLGGRWEDDLFNPELLKEAGKRLGMGAMIGAGPAPWPTWRWQACRSAPPRRSAPRLAAPRPAAGARYGASWRELPERRAGADGVILGALLLADHLLDLARALEQRGHAAQDKLRLDDGRIDEDGLRPVAAPGAARGHPDWERGEGRRGAGGSDRQALEAEIARELDRRFDSPVA